MGEVRYGSIGGLEYSPPVPVVLSVYQRGSLLDGLAMHLSCEFHDNESTHILHNFWTSTHRGKLSPSPLAAPLVRTVNEYVADMGLNNLSVHYRIY